MTIVYRHFWLTEPFETMEQDGEKKNQILQQRV